MDHIDKQIRTSYRGGSTEVYKCQGENLYYYDMNSMYSAAMLKPMPFEFKCKIDNVDLDNFFGFVKAKIHVPDTVFNPFIPFKDPSSDNILYPYGNFNGIFFSEELKLAIAHGYKVYPEFGLEFNKKELFTDYIDHFYEKKLNAKETLYLNITTNNS